MPAGNGQKRGMSGKQFWKREEGEGRSGIFGLPFSFFDFERKTEGKYYFFLKDFD